MKKNIEYLYTIKNKTQIYIKIVNCGLDESESNLFYQTFENYTDEIYIENVVDLWNGTSKDFIEKHSVLQDIYGRELNHAKVCPKIFYSMTICDNGDVVLCGADWTSQYKLGNVTSKSLFEIWNGSELRDIQLKHLQFKKDEINICRNCSVLKVCIPDNVDNNADKIIQRFHSNIEGNF